MAPRQTVIAQSIAFTILNSKENGTSRRQLSLLARLLGLFRLYWLNFELVREELFRALRGTWNIGQNEYKSSFNGDAGNAPLVMMGDMGFSGSTFFRTRDGAYLVKSIPRKFEHDFFKKEMLLPYADYMRANPGSLLVRITDLLISTQVSIGSLLGLAPTHHIVMENMAHGSHQQADHPAPVKHESWDLKPMSYFYPERDVAGGAFSSEETKSKLADEFEGKIRLPPRQAADFTAQLEKDTAFLADCNSVDYSLFLVRIPASAAPGAGSRPSSQPNNDRPPDPPSWHTGITSSDGKYVYRAAVLDFFWAAHSLHAKAMTGLIRGYNLFDQQGPMSVTATGPEYRQRFLRMCREMIEVQR